MVEDLPRFRRVQRSLPFAELLDTEAFGRRKLSVPVDLAQRKWVRLEVWDMARNGAFTQPVWLD